MKSFHSLCIKLLRNQNNRYYSSNTVCIILENIVVIVWKLLNNGLYNCLYYESWVMMIDPNCFCDNDWLNSDL